MSCTSPLLAFQKNPGDKLVFLNRDKWTIGSAEKYFGKDKVLLIPCGHCSSCLLSYRKEYAIRCVMEAKYHSSTSFLTLTYDDDHNPGRLIKKDFQKFIKCLRNKVTPLTIRYFGCGEYGGTTHRPHYHLILFGYNPEDLKYFTDSPSGKAIFTSKFLSTVWNKGFVTVQEFSPNAAGYVAGYVSKKQGCDDGFLLMSKRPGIGYQYLIDHASEIEKYDQVVGDFGRWRQVHPPKYWNRLAENLGIDLSDLKNRRRDAVDDSLLTVCQDLGLDNKEAYIELGREKDNKRLVKLRRKL